MYVIPVVKLNNKEVEDWLRKRSFQQGVTVSSTVREALIQLMNKEKGSNLIAELGDAEINPAQDPRLSDDPLIALGAVMTAHNIKIDSNSCGAIRNGSEGAHHLFVWSGDEILMHDFSTIREIVEISANDINNINENGA